jgi:glycosyltransferase involved in cell wall biosynthesis
MTDKLPPVLILGDHFGYAGGVVHGVTTYYLKVIPALLASGLQVTACFLREPHEAAKQLQQCALTPVFLSAHKFDPLVVFRVANLVRASGSRIIHAHGIKGTLVARLVGRLTGAKVLLHVHDMIYPGAGVSALHRLAARDSDIGLCVSDAVRDVAAHGYHVLEQQLRVIHNGIPLEPFTHTPAGTRERVRASLGLTPGQRVLAMIARMHPVKGHRNMLKIFSMIAQQRSDAVLMLVGDGPERGPCEAITRELKLEKQVKFLGSRSDVPDLLAAADLIVIPSESEGLGLAGIEAQAASRPVVGFDSGGLRDVVKDGVDGFLVQAGNLQAFAAAALRLLDTSQVLVGFDQRAGSAGDRFSIESHIRQLLGYYAQAVADPGNDLAPRALTR